MREEIQEDSSMGRERRGMESEECYEKDQVEEGSSRVGSRARPFQTRETLSTLEEANAGSTRKISAKAKKLKAK